MQRVRARQAPYGGLGQPWVMPWGPGTNLSGLFNLYPSLGDVTLAADLPTDLDGPMKVFRFGSLTINTVRTVTNRCRGAVILCDSLIMGAAGAFSMTARGAAGSAKWANQDILVPTSAVFSGRNTDRAAFLAYLAATGNFAFDPTLFACPPPGMGDVVADYASWPGRGTAIISASGCGSGAQGAVASAWSTSSLIVSNGNTGGAGSGAPGGGGGGGVGLYNDGIPYTGGGAGGNGGPARPWASGPGGGRMWYRPSGKASDAGKFTDYPGEGYPDNNGIGVGPGSLAGVLIIIVRGDVSLSSGHSLTSAGAASAAGTGSSGGGYVGLFLGGALSGSPNIMTPGGSAVSSSGITSGPGGAGSGISSTFSAMGW